MKPTVINTNIDKNIISKIIKFCRIHHKTLTKKEKVSDLTTFQRLRIFMDYQKFTSQKKKNCHRNTKIWLLSQLGL